MKKTDLMHREDSPFTMSTYKKKNDYYVYHNGGKRTKDVFELTGRSLFAHIILSTLSITSHGFALGFPKGLVPMEMYSLLINP